MGSRQKVQRERVELKLTPRVTEKLRWIGEYEGGEMADAASRMIVARYAYLQRKERLERRQEWEASLNGAP
jgi:uncharacterized alpha-E superfamily protein